MERSWKIRRVSLLAAVWLVAATSARGGDTIVLKNGRRIIALSVTQEGEKIIYETASGTLSIPRSIVDHIEHRAVSSSEAPASASTVTLKPPESEASSATLPANAGEIVSRVIQNGEVDRIYVDQLDQEAHSGQALANQNAAMAHHAASQFELTHGEMDPALQDARSALIYLPEQPVLLMNTAYLYLRRSEYTQSLEYIERARRLVPEDPEVLKLAGWAYYGLNKMDLAVAEWKHAASLRPDAEVEAALQRAQRDKQEEEQYKENESNHFTLRYSGASEPSLARSVLHTLERHYGAIESELNYSPPDSIGVILYTQQAFADITQVPGWVGALNDGRIRVPVQGLNDVTPELSRVLKHELTHSFVGQKTLGRAPTWVQEGLAQWMEGKRSDLNAGALIALYKNDPALGLKHFAGDWMKLSNAEATAAYAWALANVEYIVQAGGINDVDRMLYRLAVGDTAEAAVKVVMHCDYADFTRDTVQYLRSKYGNSN
jgi:tetratricopeptide (TPR) repeat protein